MSGMFLRHVWIRLRSVARDLPGLGLLVLAGLSTWLFWPILTVPHPAARGWSSATAMGVVLFVFLVVFGPVVHWPISGALAGRSQMVTRGRVLPALPIGTRTRVVAEAVVGLLCVLLARVPGLVVVAVSQGWLSSGPRSSITSVLIWFSWMSFIGALATFPLLLAWAAVPGFGSRHLVPPIAVTALVTLGAMTGATSAPVLGIRWTPAVLSLGLSIIVLFLVDREFDFKAARRWGREARLVLRPSPGPEAQLARDEWLGPLRRLWPWLVAVLACPLTLAALGWRPLSWRGLAFLQLLALSVILFFPYGLRLVPGTGRGASAIFSGYFAGAWAVLPVRRVRVLRGVYAYGWLSGALLVLLLCAYALWGRYDAGSTFDPLLALPKVAVAASLMVCVAVGDHRRGTLALGALLALQLAIPMGLILVQILVFNGLSLSEAGNTYATIFSWGVGIAGSLPALAHLRSDRGSPEAASSST